VVGFLQVFMLSAVSPAKMAEVIINLKQVLKPGGHVLVRDYAMGDLAQERLTRKDQKISENFFARGDGTCIAVKLRIAPVPLL
jgi:methyltransferase-like protein 6